jgi:hypothetical protein
MARALKTYTAEIDGLHQWIVAAANQRAALDAFGLHQNLFAQGLAAETKEPELVEAAAGAKGQPLRRLKSGKGGFEAVESDVSDWSNALDAAKAKPKARKAPSRAALDRARKALAQIETDGAEELETLEAERDAVEARLTAARNRLEKQTDKARAAVETAEAAWRKAGG